MVYFEEHTPPKREADIAMTEVKEKALVGARGRERAAVRGAGCGKK